MTKFRRAEHLAMRLEALLIAGNGWSKEARRLRRRLSAGEWRLSQDPTPMWCGNAYNLKPRGASDSGSRLLARLDPASRAYADDFFFFQKTGQWPGPLSCTRREELAKIALHGGSNV